MSDVKDWKGTMGADRGTRGATQGACEFAVYLARLL